MKDEFAVVRDAPAVPRVIKAWRWIRGALWGRNGRSGSIGSLYYHSNWLICFPKAKQILNVISDSSAVAILIWQNVFALWMLVWRSRLMDLHEVVVFTVEDMISFILKGLLRSPSFNGQNGLCLLPHQDARCSLEQKKSNFTTKRSQKRRESQRTTGDERAHLATRWRDKQQHRALIGCPTYLCGCRCGRLWFWGGLKLTHSASQEG